MRIYSIIIYKKFILLFELVDEKWGYHDYLCGAGECVPEIKSRISKKLGDKTVVLDLRNREYKLDRWVTFPSIEVLDEDFDRVIL